jgi:hypothetical protein
MYHQTCAAMIETRNYLNDPRVRAREAGGLFVRIDELTMTGTVSVFDDDGDREEAVIGFRYCVCDTCSGRGRHTNPSIDAGGLSGDWDEDDMPLYLSGAYDVPCYGCGGSGLTPEPAPRNEAEEKILARIAEDEAGRAETRAMHRAEMMMGA